MPGESQEGTRRVPETPWSSPGHPERCAYRQVAREELMEVQISMGFRAVSLRLDAKGH